MYQLKVLRCEICQAPFLFESSLEDHKNRAHGSKESDLGSAKSADKKKQIKSS